MTSAEAMLVKIDNLQKVENSDTLEYVTLGGYTIVVKKDQSKEG